MSVRIVLHPDKKSGYIVICTSQNVSLGRFLLLQYVILANVFPSLTNPVPFSFILAMIYLTKKKKTDVSHFECNFSSVITNRKHGESTICNPKGEGKEPAEWQSDVSCFLLDSNNSFSNYQYQIKVKLTVRSNLEKLSIENEAFLWYLVLKQSNSQRLPHYCECA